MEENKKFVKGDSVVLKIEGYDDYEKKGYDFRVFDGKKGVVISNKEGFVDVDFDGINVIVPDVYLNYSNYGKNYTNKIDLLRNIIKINKKKESETNLREKRITVLCYQDLILHICDKVYNDYASDLNYKFNCVLKINDGKRKRIEERGFERRVLSFELFLNGTSVEKITRDSFLFNDIDKDLDFLTKVIFRLSLGASHYIQTYENILKLNK